MSARYNPAIAPDPPHAPLTRGLPVSDGLATLTAAPAGDASPRLDVRVGGVHVRSVQLTPGEPTAIRAFWPAGGLAFVELEVTPPAGKPAGKEEIHVSVAGR